MKGWKIKTVSYNHNIFPEEAGWEPFAVVSTSNSYTKIFYKKELDMKESGEEIRTSRDFLDELLKFGKRQTELNREGHFVIDLEKWDELCERVKKESCL